MNCPLQDGQAEPTGAAGRRASNQGLLSISLEKYLELLDWTGRQVREGKRGAIPSLLAPILERLGIRGEKWVDAVESFHEKSGLIVRLRPGGGRRGRARWSALVPRWEVLQRRGIGLTDALLQKGSSSRGRSTNTSRLSNGPVRRAVEDLFCNLYQDRWSTGQFRDSHPVAASPLLPPLPNRPSILQSVRQWPETNASEYRPSGLFHVWTLPTRPVRLSSRRRSN